MKPYASSWKKTSVGQDGLVIKMPKYLLSTSYVPHIGDLEVNKTGKFLCHGIYILEHVGHTDNRELQETNFRNYILS